MGSNVIENYNGIMLCKRPSPGASINIQPQRHSYKPKLNLGSKEGGSCTSNKPKVIASSNQEGLFSKPWGSTRIIPEKAKVLSRLSRNDGALRRHKQWLKQMQIQREEQVKEKEEEIRLRQEKKREFMAKQAKRRARAREMEEPEANNDECEKSDDREPLSGKRSRPAWSLTETEANDVHDCLEAQEEEELMDFVEDLDFEQFYDDMELNVLMSQLKNRIHMLEKEKTTEESWLQTVVDVSEVMRSNMHSIDYPL